MPTTIPGRWPRSPAGLNPYKLGIELLRDIEERWNKGQFGPEWDECDNLDARRKWDKKLGLGRQKIFEVRRIHNDVTFIDTFLTVDFCRRYQLFSYRHNDQSEMYEIESREFKKIKERLALQSDQLRAADHPGQGCQSPQPR